MTNYKVAWSTASGSGEVLWLGPQHAASLAESMRGNGATATVEVM